MLELLSYQADCGATGVCEGTSRRSWKAYLRLALCNRENSWAAAETIIPSVSAFLSQQDERRMV